MSTTFPRVMIARVAVSARRLCLLRPTSQIDVFKCAKIRSYATHRNHAPDLLSQTLDVKRGTRREDTVGPFILGVPPSQQGVENVKKWSELSPGGKGVWFYRTRSWR